MAESEIQYCKLFITSQNFTIFAPVHNGLMVDLVAKTIFSFKTLLDIASLYHYAK